ncbi:hypothetical protein NDU88_004150 [Pleurodeles waltl]|uniref:Uncharacterized protein n=1 Tax=Pleurodeles waltl TaxID=8319 RepID=A0AAV7L0L7_PLEWA|nr:hypothetical protein NDU88_004150 [Pleurodeles waltl]
MKKLRREVRDLGQRVDTLEQMQDARKEEVDSHRRELLALQERNLELQYELEDLENKYPHQMSSAVGSVGES